MWVDENHVSQSIYRWLAMFVSVVFCPRASDTSIATSTLLCNSDFLDSPSEEEQLDFTESLFHPLSEGYELKMNDHKLIYNESAGDSLLYCKYRFGSMSSTDSPRIAIQVVTLALISQLQ